ncbi:MAG: hypothetical protein KIT58_07940 [Planctomycetota bacterium]|nr:hypothetical protein [Planctomycetota bacterium]
MSVKKSRELRFTYEDADGALRAVVLQVQHQRDGGADKVKVQVLSEHAPVEVEVFERPKVKRGRARTSSG